jgi:hypothetical protein
LEVSAQPVAISKRRDFSPRFAAARRALRRPWRFRGATALESASDSSNSHGTEDNKNRGQLGVLADCAIWRSMIAVNRLSGTIHNCVSMVMTLAFAMTRN